LTSSIWSIQELKDYGYNMQFHSNQPTEENAEVDMMIKFDKHKCKREDASQAAARIVRESTEE